MSNPLPKDFPEDAEKQLRLFEMFLKRCSPEEGYVLATLGTAIRLIACLNCGELLSRSPRNWPKN